jgi:putative flavoprotein involved in K+ transport
VLHNQVHVNHLPYMPFPPNWPIYIPKDKLAGWFEYYAEAMELNFWTGNRIQRRRLRRDRRPLDGGAETTRRHPHSAPATCGYGHQRHRHPQPADNPDARPVQGEVIHSSAYTGAQSRKDKRVLIIGTGTSAHDMAQDLQSNGATVSLIQRGATSIINVEPSAQLPYTLYDEGLSLETADLIATATPYEPLKAVHTAMAEESTRLDKDMLDALEKVGFRIDHEDKTGWQFKFMNRGGGYYFNVGCSDLIIDGKVGLIQFDDIDTFVAEGAKLKNGDVVAGRYRYPCDRLQGSGRKRQTPARQ